MSYFVFGEIEFRTEVSEARLVRMSFEFEEAALRERIFIQLGPGIVQKLLFEILSEQRGPTTGATLPFFITDSPVSDVSHEVIKLPNMIPQTHDEWADALRKNLERIARVLSWLLEVREVKSVVLIFSEGYDTTYDLV